MIEINSFYIYLIILSIDQSMDFLNICKDMILLICNYLSDDSVINLFSTCRDFYEYTKIYIFNEYHPYDKVIKKSYYDSFTSINKYNEGLLPKKIL